jgi:hypothetical protein
MVRRNPIAWITDYLISLRCLTLKSRQTNVLLSKICSFSTLVSLGFPHQLLRIRDGEHTIKVSKMHHSRLGGQVGGRGSLCMLI